MIPGSISNMKHHTKCLGTPPW